MLSQCSHLIGQELKTHYYQMPLQLAYLLLSAFRYLLQHNSSSCLMRNRIYKGNYNLVVQCNDVRQQSISQSDQSQTKKQTSQSSPLSVQRTAKSR